ncbi:hypothetical protein B5C34_14155 [Pacificimonas flava]|uniref:DUF4440 domain-containing protein n=2 Tax=Pacificimonas TaxID=1960290 RepID=A0A219B8N4_9SPHN|nr:MULTISPECIES: DUF4440 domain-containing protein [Pacificimonas]MBZ6379966.1 nuclear transport factor 2 family protein [Pacificimonas aurantium]OWV34486.1 hypothetical protein B5C34_14155 [Pacificimonas flava]
MEITDEDVWAREERLWTGGADAYAELLDNDALMVFPEMGALNAASVRKSIERAPRWESVDMRERSLVRPAQSLIVIAYRAESRRSEEPAYAAFCSSTYRAVGNGWRIVQHQQTLAN